MREFIEHLDRIAEANDVRFKYAVHIRLSSNGLAFTFQAVQVNPFHDILTTHANSFDALHVSESAIASMCADFDLEYVK